jgi:hypothetical protein
MPCARGASQEESHMRVFLLHGDSDWLRNKITTLYNATLENRHFAKRKKEIKQIMLRYPEPG